jgi:hypothetical protein
MGRLAGLAALSCALGAAPASAGFLQPEGTTQVISTTSVSSFSQDFQIGTRLRRSVVFSKTSLDTHYASGLTRDVTLIGQLTSDQVMAQLVNQTLALSSWSAIAGLRVRLHEQGNTIVSAQVLAGPGRALERSGLVADARLLVGHGFRLGTMPAFADVQLGYRLGAPGDRQELRLDASLGFDPHPSWQVLSQVFVAYGFQNGVLPASLRVKTRLSLIWRFSEQWAVQLGGFSTVYGRHAPTETGASLGIWRQF